MLLVGGRVQADYHEENMLRMFKKVDINADRLIDLNEFLLMQTSKQPRREPHAGAGEAEAEAEADVPVGVHPHPKLRLEDPRDEDWR